PLLTRIQTQESGEEHDVFRRGQLHGTFGILGPDKRTDLEPEWLIAFVLQCQQRARGPWESDANRGDLERARREGPGLEDQAENHCSKRKSLSHRTVRHRCSSCEL